MPEIVPSLLAADFLNLKKEIEAVEEQGAKRLHLDIMDGHFVPNISFGPFVVEAIRKITNLHLETHLMIDNPEKYIKSFADAGSDTILVHWESSLDIETDLSSIKNLGLKAGMVINPGTTIVEIKSMLPLLDQLLIMTVVPGFGGQKMMKDALNKVELVKPISEQNGFLLEIDGGVRINTIYEAVNSGADLYVAGSSIFKNRDPGQAFRELSGLLYI